MALSYVQYSGDGSTQTFAIPYPYLDKSHIEVRVALDVTSYTWDDPNTIRITPPPAAGAVVEARRFTPREERMVDFTDGSVLTEQDLDLATIQTFYIVQEAIDIAGGTLELLADGSYGAGGRRIREVGSPVHPRDAVTKEYHDGTFLPALTDLLNQATAARDGAVTARAGAEAARDAAVAARDLALQYRNTADAHRAAAATSEANALAHKNAAEGFAGTAVGAASTAVSAKDAAYASQGAAWAHREEARGYKDEALAFRNTAETHKNAAAASAAAAATFDPAAYVPKAGGAYSGPVTAPQLLSNTNIVVKNQSTAIDGYWQIQSEGGILKFYYWNGAAYTLCFQLAPSGLLQAGDVGIL